MAKDDVKQAYKLRVSIDDSLHHIHQLYRRHAAVNDLRETLDSTTGISQKPLQQSMHGGPELATDE